MDELFFTTNSLPKDDVIEICNKIQLSCSTSSNTHTQRNEPEFITFIMSYMGQISCILIAEFIKEFIFRWKEKKKNNKRIIIKFTPNEKVITIPENITVEQLKQILKIVKELEKKVTQVIIIDE